MIDNTGVELRKGQYVKVIYGAPKQVCYGIISDIDHALALIKFDGFFSWRAGSSLVNISKDEYEQQIMLQLLEK
jgi:hypothetical protein